MKQEALDRGAAFPLPGDVLCERCKATFATLELGHGVCVDLRQGRLPDAVRDAIMERIGEAA